MRARWYDPATAQFLSIDPLVTQTGATYDYADDAPLNNTDPTGADGLWPDLACLVPEDGICELVIYNQLADDAADALASEAAAEAAAAAAAAEADEECQFTAAANGAFNEPATEGLPGHADQLPSDGDFPYEAPKGSNGEPVRLPRGQGFKDSDGNIWKWARPGAQHGGPHWDVQLKGGGYTNVYPDGSTR